jgi:hypothetical protein
MRHPWYKANPELLKQEMKEIQTAYPDLHVVYEENDCILIRGSFPLIHDGVALDRYLIEIELPQDYPASVPIVREVGGQIPRTIDYHIVNDTGQACLFLPDERWRVYPRGTRLVEFLSGPMRNFFLGQSLVRRGQPWPFGQWGHGAQGVYEYYTDLLGTDDLDVILKYLEWLAKERIKGHWSCPCGSGKRVRNCHFSKLQDLRAKIPRSVAMRSWRLVGSLRTPRHHRGLSPSV